jgi:hypothetical protein
MTMTRQLSLLLALTLAACGGDTREANETIPRSDTPVSSDDPVGPTPRPSTPQDPADHWAGLIKLPGVKALPAHQQYVGTPGYPGSGFHLGVFRNAADWQTFADAAGITLGPVDWDRQVVAYLVLDAQTNKLEWKGLAQTGNTAVLTVDWIGIEPYYTDSTPAVLAVLNRAGLDQLRIELTEDHGQGTVLGTIAL